MKRLLTALAIGALILVAGATVGAATPNDYASNNLSFTLPASNEIAATMTIPEVIDVGVNIDLAQPTLSGGQLTNIMALNSMATFALDDDATNRPAAQMAHFDEITGALAQTAATARPPDNSYTQIVAKIPDVGLNQAQQALAALPRNAQNPGDHAVCLAVYRSAEKQIVPSQSAALNAPTVKVTGLSARVSHSKIDRGSTIAQEAPADLHHFLLRGTPGAHRFLAAA